MDLAVLYQKLMASARAGVPSDHVPYAFEKRVLARLKAQPALDLWAAWARALWRAAAPCVGIMLLLSAWALLGSASPPPASGSASGDLTQQFESTLLAAAEQEQASDSTW